MIQVRQIRIETKSVEPNPSGPILLHLTEKLDKEKFFGKLLLTFENGILRNVKVEQSLSVKDLTEMIIR